MNLIKIFFLALCLVIPKSVYGILDGGGSYAQIPYLIRLVSENVKRYRQLREMIRQSKERHFYERLIHQGLDNAAGLILSIPVKDAKILEDLNTFQETVSALEELYGTIQGGADSEMFKLHDQTVAESLGLINQLKAYATEQERNAETVFWQAKRASPKGAARMSAVTSSQILHALSQLIRINGQMLKLQSEAFASQNKLGKDSARHFEAVNQDMGKISIKHVLEKKLPQF